MSVGGVGGGGAPSAGSSANAGGTSTGNVSGGEGVTTGSCENASTKDISDAGDKSGTTYNITQIQNNNMWKHFLFQVLVVGARAARRCPDRGGLHARPVQVVLVGAAEVVQEVVEVVVVVVVSVVAV